jgi:hypothetical protein
MNRRKGQSTVTALDAEKLQQGIRALGDFAHVEVRAARGHLHIIADSSDPVARATPLGQGQFGLSFRSHTGRWEPMPVSGDLAEVADAAVTMLGPHLARWDFTGRTSDPTH